jgi:DNA-binding NtrC family response regulator
MKILIADDDPVARRIIEQTVLELKHEATAAAGGEEAWTLFQRGAPEVVISDWFMPDLDGLELCRRIRASPRESYVYIILITGSRSLGSRTEAMDSGADDFLPKPVDAEDLRVRLMVASRITSLYRRTIQAEARAAALEEETRSRLEVEGMIGASAPMQDAFRRIRLAAQSEVTVLVTGESGTGKELAARALHAHGPRRDGPFLAINCGALPDPLLESELFGHVKGAFTGAHQTKAGLFEAANGGTLFLDEVGDVSPALQIKLLRALQEREIRRVGDDQVRKVDVRIVTATNRDLKKLVAEGKVREDFFYRIRVFEIHLPPLRARRDDIPLLAARLLEDMSGAQKKPTPRLSPQALQKLVDYPWPGNIRELRNAIEHALVVAEAGVVDVGDLPGELRAPTRSEPSTAEGQPSGGALDDEAQRILDALKSNGGNRVETAKQLGISRVTLWKKLKRLGIDPDSA